MSSNIRLVASASVLAVAALSASPAFAAGTAAGTPINNSVTLTYKVGGVDQSSVSASDSFVVDRKVNLTVAEVGSATTSVSPGQTAAVTTFLVTNTSNAALDFALAPTQLSGGTAAHGGTDNFNVNNVLMYADTNNNGSYDAGTDTAITYLDELAADDSKRVFVVADVPLGRSTADVAGVRLTATAAESSGSVGALGATVTQSTGANTIGVDTVFADTNANGNVARDGAHFAEDDYTVLAAAITAAKTNTVISDPLNGTTNPKMIPGAVVEYCIKVQNAAGGTTASNVSVSDTVPTATTYDSSFGIKVNGTVTGSTCNADGTSGGSFASGTVSATMADIAAGTTRTVVFRVSVN
ncbi:MAG TPA: hypothetical protein VF727_08890 [Allosphingosinicella sp.]|jgi:uncharacterized repeat protein (TIGR01451 family)